MPILPLAGIRVLEFGIGAVAPHLARQLADFGADTIKIETKKKPEMMRGSQVEKYEKAIGFASSSRNKRSLALDLSCPEGVKIAKRLIRVADVVVENFSVRVMTKWGLDYPSLHKIKPNIIAISLQGMGHTGPHSDYVIQGPNLPPLAGVTYLWSHADAPNPVGSQLYHPDHFAAVQGAAYVLAALDYRGRTGRGCYIDAAQVEIAASLLGPSYLDYTVNRRIQKPVGNRSPYAAPHGCYRCKGDDCWCAITIYSDEEWDRFCLAIGNPTWTEDNRFETLHGRLENVEELERLVEEWTIGHSPQEAMDILQKTGVTAGAIEDAHDLCQDPHLRERGFLVDIDHPVMGKVVYDGIPMKLSASPGNVQRHAPLLGQDTEEVCHELLGMSKGHIEELILSGVLV